MHKEPVTDFATDWDHTDPQWVNNPYPIWDDLRERCPVAHTERYGGGWFPTTHEMIAEIANDTEHFTSRQVVIVHNKNPELMPPAPIGGAPPITSDPPFHQIARRLILPAFAPGPVRALEDQVRALCAKHLDALTGETRFDAGARFARYISPGVISRMLGFPEADEDQFRDFVHLVLDLIDLPTEERIPLFAPMTDYFDQQIADHVAHPRDDFTSYLLNVEIDGQKLSPEHVRGTMVLTLVAGIDTTWSAIGSAIWHLAQHPEDLARLVNEPDLMPVAVEEFLRFYAPVTMARLVKEDMEFHGHDFKANDWVLLGFPAANRDPAVFKDADQFIIDRAINRHAAFGLGIHRCAGSNLARMELRVAIEEFIARFPRFTLDEDEPVTWAPGQVRGPRAIPLRVL
ncbi:MAG: cytochrome P450 [Acidobacteriota bacterium]|nr:cytochrome P450 [Acidobacteriota bacterium]MDE3044259.1 cytochrome P450 [Acidobacteriota bacterium]MDE3106604.1 cytochrome P450 [Acidobacteriota bacterium]MDE3222065.1 cytochrome P450 [Acidobacteriota bacterium]